MTLAETLLEKLGDWRPAGGGPAEYESPPARAWLDRWARRRTG